MKRNQLIGMVVLLVAVGSGAFYSGMAYAKSSTSARSNFAAGGAGANFAGRGFGRAGSGATGGFTAGQIISASNGSVSIQEQNGSSTEIVLIGPSTQILKQASGTAADLTVGTNVIITGTSNSDGSMNAASIQIRPAGMAGGFGGVRTNTPGASPQ